MKTIDLGKKASELYGSPCECKPTEPDKDRIIYPSVYIENPELDNLPPEGTITFRYRLTQDTNKRNFKGDKPQRSHCVEMDLTEIQDVTGEKEPAKDRGETLDSMYAEKKKAKETKPNPAEESDEGE